MNTNHPTEADRARAYIARIERRLAFHAQSGLLPAWEVEQLQELLVEAREDFRRGIF